MNRLQLLKIYVFICFYHKELYLIMNWNKFLEFLKIFKSKSLSPTDGTVQWETHLGESDKASGTSHTNTGQLRNSGKAETVPAKTVPADAAIEGPDVGKRLHVDVGQSGRGVGAGGTINVHVRHGRDFFMDVGGSRIIFTGLSSNDRQSQSDEKLHNNIEIFY